MSNPTATSRDDESSANGVRDDWPVTRVEFLGFHRTSVALEIFLGLAAIVGVFILLAGIVVTVVGLFRGEMWWLPLILGLELGGLPIAACILHRRRNRTWSTLAPRIWEADGCVCPWCHEDVRSGPCEPHGVGPDHRELLIEYHTNPAFNRPPDPWRLQQAGARPPRRWLRSATGIPWFRKQFQTMVSPGATAEQRARAWWRVTPVYLVGVVLGGFAFRWLFGPAGSPAVWTFAAFSLAAPIFWRSNPIRSIARRCRRCRHECPDLARQVCVECGADLTRPGSTTRLDVDTRALFVAFPVIFIVMIAFMFGPIILPRLVSPGVAARVFAWTGTPTGYYMDLDLTTMTPAQVKVQADLLLAEVRADPDGQRYVGGFLHDALAAGLIPETYREQAARATADATLAVERDDAGWMAVITPDFGESIMFDQPRVGVGRVTVDGAAIGAEHAWTLRAKDLDPDHRRRWLEAAAKQGLPEEPYFEPLERLAWRIPLDLPPGEHLIEARCWIVLGAPPYRCLDLAYDDEGAPILSDEHHVYELKLQDTVTVP